MWNKKLLIIYNPKSGSQIINSKLDAIIEYYQKKNVFVHFYRLKNNDNFENFLQNTAIHTYDRIAIGGGDGTLNSVINYLINNDIDIPIAIIPTGTANDFASYLKIPKDLAANLDYIINGEIIQSDLGFINGQYFINIASAGILMDISSKTHKIAKNTLGKLAYYLKTVEEIPKFKSFNLDINIDDEKFQENIYFILIMNGASAGGFNKLAPTASIQDGKLDIVIFKKSQFINLIPVFIKVLSGVHVDSPHIIYKKASTIEIDTDVIIPTDIDGELGPSAPLSIQCINNKIQLIVPNQ